jgi:hypothetical protein
VRWSIQRQVVNAFDLLPAIWVHRLGLRPHILDRTPESATRCIVTLVDPTTDTSRSADMPGHQAKKHPPHQLDPLQTGLVPLYRESPLPISWDVATPQG